MWRRKTFVSLNHTERGKEQTAAFLGVQMEIVSTVRGKLENVQKHAFSGLPVGQYTYKLPKLKASPHLTLLK
jgi:hypothetical protein